MLNETNSELQERSDSAAIEEMMVRTDIQIPARIYTGDEYFERRAIAEQQEIAAKEWNKHYYGY